jgi:hypothetical protein
MLSGMDIPAPAGDSPETTDAMIAELAADGQRTNPKAVAAMWEARQAGIEERRANPVERSPGPLKVSYTHDAMIDLMIANPMITQNAIAAHFGYTPSWVSIVMSSDAYRARLEARREELVDPTIRVTIEERFRALAVKSLEVLQKKLEQPTVSDSLAIQAAALASKSLGLGQGATPVPVQPDRIERLGGRLLALLGERAVQSLDKQVIDVPSRPVEPAPLSPEGSL